MVFEDSESRDPKRYLWIMGTIAPGCALLPVILVTVTGLQLFWWIGPIIVFLLIPLLDLAIGDDHSNVRDEDYESLSEDRYYRWCTYLFLPLQLTGLIVAGYLWSDIGLNLLDKIGLAATLGVVSGIGINAAHELGHRSEHLERRMAKLALAQSGYGHFYVEHNRGHHVRVATPADPASGRMGESLWEFLPRTIFGGLRSAWTLERERLSRKDKPWFSPGNHILQAWSLTSALFATMILAFGHVIIPFLLLQALIGIVLVEAVNYIEHYGLLRPRRPDGRFARCSPRDSWNSDRLVTNVFLFHLQRHSDHHINPGRRYHTLRGYEQAPQLPGGYASMILLAAVPPLWRAVMDHRVLALYGGDIALVNTKPAPHRRLPRLRRRTGRRRGGGGPPVLSPADSR